jgi:hypothetical protein
LALSEQTTTAGVLKKVFLVDRTANLKEYWLPGFQMKKKTCMLRKGVGV